MNTIPVIYRARQPVTVDGRTGYLDFWSKDLDKVLDNVSGSPDRVFQTLTLSDIEKLPPGQKLKAMHAWENAFG